MEDLTSKKFGRLTVIKLHHKKQQYKSNGNKGGFKYYWLCKCDCGNEKVIWSGSLKNGATQSCGCLQREIVTKIKTTHNLTNSKIYYTYNNIKQRCYCLKDKYYKDYGERGITVCQDWLNDFMNFYNWSMNNGYNDNLTIDRIDNNKGYSSDNCRWVDNITQANNKRNNHYITYNNETHTMAEWSRILDIKYNKFKHKIRKGLSIKDIIFEKKI